MILITIYPIYTSQLFYCAKRSIHPVVKKNWCPSFGFVRSFVRIIIDFCERHLEGASLKILSVIWAIDFAWSENWMAVKWVSEWDRPVRGPFFGRKKVAFLEKSAKNGHVTFTFGKGCKNHTVLNWRWWRHEEKSAQKWFFGCDSEGIRENTDWNESPLDTGLEWIQTDIICSTDPCFAPLPCTVYLVYFF